MFTEDGLLVCDDDLCDEEWMKDRTVIMSLDSPTVRTSRSVTPLPAVSTLTRCASEDTLSMGSSQSSCRSDMSSPSSGSFGDVESESENNVVRLPTFSAPLHRDLKRFGDKQCDAESWKRASTSIPTNTNTYRYIP